MEARNKLEIRDISKVFIKKDSYQIAIEKVSIFVKENEFLVLLGPGQCGKSVLLNIIAGLEQPSTGHVYLDGKQILGVSKQIGLVFQKIGILPWLTVIDNVSCGMKYSGMKRVERYLIAQKYIDMVKLNGFEKHYPRQLSGGMKQRVGIARAYANNSEVLLMDEPFGQLDAQTRYAMQEEILRIWQNNKRTVIFVTNNIEEAVYLGDRIILYSKQPMKQIDEYDLSGIPRPREYTDDVFLSIRNDITKKMDLALE